MVVWMQHSSLIFPKTSEKLNVCANSRYQALWGGGGGAGYEAIVLLTPGRVGLG